MAQRPRPTASANMKPSVWPSLLYLSAVGRVSIGLIALLVLWLALWWAIN
ncbi:hypothetical protein [Halochromatium glycolicum]|nr:hypothetical protein [Halochromatium glycolicum]